MALKTLNRESKHRLLVPISESRFLNLDSLGLFWGSAGRCFENFDYTKSGIELARRHLGEAMQTKVESVLIVDDDTINGTVLSTFLNDEGYRASHVLGGEEGIRLARSGDVDLVLLDVMMPDPDGLSILKALRETLSPTKLPVVMVTAKNQSSDVVRAMELGANDYITKPLDFPVALSRIRTQLSLKRAQEALRLSEERYALAVQGANDGIWDWDFNLDEIFYSARWYEMLGIKEHVGPSPKVWLDRVHPDDLGALLSAISAHREGKTEHFEHQHRLLHENGSYRWVLSRAFAARNGAGEALRMVGSLADVTDHFIMDPLTQLPNRTLLLDRLRSSMQRAQRKKNYLFGLLLLDLDRFVAINDSLGPRCGDLLLNAVAQRLRQSTRAGDTLARLSGDEFAILLDDIASLDEMSRVARRIQSALSAPFDLCAEEVHVRPNIGMRAGAARIEEPNQILRDAGVALRRAKDSSVSNVEGFDAQHHIHALQSLQLENDLRRAVERSELQLYYQPIVSLRDKQLQGFEALLRWRHPVRGQVAPNDFIPVAEASGEIIKIGDWVLREACHQLRDWQQRSGMEQNLFMSINVSGKQLMETGLMARLGKILLETGVEARDLKFEITESVLIENCDPEVLGRIRDLGIQWSLDDFGTGYSSLSYLHRFPISTLKIDRSFVSRLGPTERDDRPGVIVKAIVTLAHNLGLEVIAEGVETEDQLNSLKALGCEYGQGYYFAKPLSSSEASVALVERMSRALVPSRD